MDTKKLHVALGPSVRKKADRLKLEGHDCQECEKFWKSFKVTDIKEKINKCSRHRYNYAAPKTPPYFWEAGFPDDEECKRRGYIH